MSTKTPRTGAPSKRQKSPQAPKTTTAPPPTDLPVPGGKLGILVRLLGQDDGATLEEMTAATGWQTHSVRGAVAGSLKKRGFIATSTKADPRGPRRYQLVGASITSGEG